MGAVGAAMMLVFFTARTVRGSTDDSSKVCSTAAKPDGRDYALWTLDLGKDSYIRQIIVTTTENNEDQDIAKNMVVCVVPSYHQGVELWNGDIIDWTQPSEITDCTLDNFPAFLCEKNDGYPKTTETFDFNTYGHIYGQYVVIFAKNFDLCQELSEVKPVMLCQVDKHCPAGYNCVDGACTEEE